MIHIVSCGLSAAAQASAQLNGINLLGIEMEHTAVVSKLPFHHRDPFDRLLIAQAMVEQMPIVSVDADFDAYNVERLW